MAGQWLADPMGRAQYRYFDGAAWTHSVATSGVQSTESNDLPLPQTQSVPQYSQYAAPATSNGGKLMAAGIMSIISGVVSLFGAIAMWQIVKSALSVTDAFDSGCNSFGGGCDTSSHVSFWGYAIVILTVAIGAGFVLAGIGAVRRAQWGRISIIVAGSIACLFYLIVLISVGEPVLLISVIWFAIITGLAAAERSTTHSHLQLAQTNA